MANLTRRQWLTMAPATLLLPGVIGAALAAPAKTAEPRGQFRGGYFPNCAMRTQDNRRVRFYDDCLKDKLVLVQFTYATCEGKCPLITANLVEVQRLLGDRVGRDIFMVSISLKPEHDTPQVLKEHAEMHGVGPGWTFLTGRRADVEALRRRFGMVDPDPVLDADPTRHTGMIRIGDVPRERWLACPGRLPAPAIVRTVLSIARPAPAGLKPGIGERERPAERWRPTRR